MKKINWLRIVATAGMNFFTTLAGSSIIDKFTVQRFTLQDVFLIALVPAAIQFGLKLCMEITKEAEVVQQCAAPKKSKSRRLAQALDYAIFFN